MIDTVNLALADKAAVYYFHHYDPELCYSALKRCENPTVIRVIGATLPIDEGDCGTWAGDGKDAISKRIDYLVANLGERQLVEKLVVDSDSAIAFKAELEHQNTANLTNIYPISTNGTEIQADNGNREGSIKTDIYPTSTPPVIELSHSLGDGTPLKMDQVQALV